MTTCKECKYYFVETSQATYTSLGETPRQQTFTNKFIECRRYPKPSPTEDDYWCGEFVGKADEVFRKCEHEWGDKLFLSMPAKVRCKKCGVLGLALPTLRNP